MQRKIKKRKARVTKKLKRKFQGFHKKITQTVCLKCSKMSHPICKKIQGKWLINTTNPDLYTKEVRKNWVCSFCKNLIKK